jgi:hypothetical protein
MCFWYSKLLGAKEIKPNLISGFSHDQIQNATLVPFSRKPGPTQLQV